MQMLVALMLPVSPISCHSLRTMFHDTRIVLLYTCSTLMIVDDIEEMLSRDKSRKRDIIPALTRRFPNESCPWLNGDWQSCVHPEGALYLYNESRKTFTEAHVVKTTFPLLDGCVDGLYDLARVKSAISQADDIELVVQLESEDQQVTCRYYFVDHAARTLFWLHDVNYGATTNIFSSLQGVDDLSHIRYALESEYWTHCERYPNHQMDRVKLIKELREVVTHASADLITSDISLSPFDADELSRILELINHLRGTKVPFELLVFERLWYYTSPENADENNFPHSICTIARFMHYFYRAKFFNACGLPCARLQAGRTMSEEDTGFGRLIDGLSLFLDVMYFWSLQTHMRSLQRMWMDGRLNTPQWKKFTTDLMTEWTGITIYSTVMLAVDVSFLTILNANLDKSQSFEVTAIYLSIIFITGSLIILLPLTQTQRRVFKTADKAAEFLSNSTSTFLGVRALATVCGLPYVMLLWGIIYFAVSLLLNMFKTATMVTSVVSTCVFVTVFVSWFIWATREIRIFRRLAKFALSFTSKVVSNLSASGFFIMSTMQWHWQELYVINRVFFSKGCR
ncbi:hypothetical protein EDB19DRAFT_767077 [Suillus lakei]|nr:hypothetical protein EDB19DRAFT_767077 [Suillus lakei]